MAVLCKASGCKKRASYGQAKPAKWCAQHKQSGDFNVNTIRCTDANCNASARWGVRGTKKPLTCKEHAFPDYVDVHKQCCLASSCDVSPTYGVSGTKKPLYCVTHAQDGHVVVRGSKRCEEKDCNVVAAFGDPDGGASKYCRTHAPDGFISVKATRCKASGCRKQPTYGASGTKKALYCAGHAPDGYVDVKSKKCAAAGCRKRASFGINGNKTHCAEHKQDGENRKKVSCAESGCDVTPTFAKEGSTVGEFCAKHSPDDYVSIDKRTCIADGCKTRPCFGPDGEKPIYCGKHKGMGENCVNVVSKKCVVPDCDTQPHYGLLSDGVKKYCGKHKAEWCTNLSAVRCCSDECSVIATFFDGSGKHWCAKHKGGKVNIKSKNKKCRIPNCEKQAKCGFENYPMRYCGQHSLMGCVMHPTVDKTKWEYCPVGCGDIVDYTSIVCDECFENYGSRLRLSSNSNPKHMVKILSMHMKNADEIERVKEFKQRKKELEEKKKREEKEAMQLAKEEKKKKKKEAAQKMKRDLANAMRKSREVDVKEPYEEDDNAKYFAVYNKYKCDTCDTVKQRNHFPRYEKLANGLYSFLTTCIDCCDENDINLRKCYQCQVVASESAFEDNANLCNMHKSIKLTNQQLAKIRGRWFLKRCCNYAEVRGGECLTETFVGNSKNGKVSFRCSEGHEWTTKYDNLQKNVWCTKCAKKNKHTLKDCTDLAKLAGFEFMDEKYVNSDHKHNWKCSKGHVWQARYRIVSSGKGCPHCAGNKKKSIEDCQKYVEQTFGGKCLSEEYINNNTLMLWECKNKHQFKMKWRFVQSDEVPFCEKCNRCPNCQVMNTGDGSWCEYCDEDSSLVKSVRKKYEISVAMYLRQELPKYGFVHNKNVGNECNLVGEINKSGRFYPDLLYDRNDWYLIVEVDENKHSGADYSCDEARMCAMAENLGLPCVFIRFNPNYKLPSDFGKKLVALKEKLIHWFAKKVGDIPFDDHTGLFVERMFY